LNKGLHDLVIAGPRVHTLNLRCICARASHPQINLRSLTSNLGSLYQAGDTEEFLSSVVGTAAVLAKSQQTFAFLCDEQTGEPDLASLCIEQACPPDVADSLRRCFERMGTPEDAAAITEGTDQGTDGADIHFLMIPVIHNSRLQAVLGIASRLQAEEPVAMRLELLRLLSRISGPFLAASRDAERLCSRMDELESILHIKSHLMSNVCHEFRSLLAAIRGYSRRVLDGRAGVISNEQRDHLAVILRNSNKLLDLVSHSVPFTAEQQLRVERFDLRDTWHRALKRMRHRISEGSIKIIEQISPEPLTVIADQERLEAVFDILLANAVRCVTRGGITAQLLRVTTGEVMVRLSAIGPVALPSELLDAIFEHRQEQAPTPHQDQQRFAGLSLAHDLIWLHGGRISVTSNPAEGTMFAFSLPSPLTEGRKPRSRNGASDRSKS
jgi:signal transduction histidine kinase